MNKKITIGILSLFLLVPILSITASTGSDPPDLKVPGKFNDLVIWIYKMVIYISALAAFAMIVYGGIEYLISAGNPEKMRSGMDKIQSAIIGILIVLISYLVLKTINPDFTKLPDLNLPEKLEDEK